MSYTDANSFSRIPRWLGGGRLWRRLAIATNWPVLAAVAVLTAVGIFTINAVKADDGRQQLQFLGIAVLCLLGFQAVSYQRIGRYAWGFYAAAFVPLLYTVLASLIGGLEPLPGVRRVNGAYNWIRIGGFGFQPSEVMKIAFIMALARYLRYRANYRKLSGLVLPFVLCLAPAVLILKQPDLGTALVFGPTLLVMLFVAGARKRHVLAIVGLGLSLVPVAWFAGAPGVPVFEHMPALIKQYQRERVYAMFREDEQTLRDTGLQQHRALIALGSGGMVGKGPSNLPVGRTVPEAENDMIFALVGEQFGFAGSVVVVVAYVVLFAAGIEIASATRDPFGRLVAVGIVAILAAQTALNVAVALKLFPVTGVTLPFVSAGGSSLIASFMAAGLLLNVGQNRPLVMAQDSFEF